MISNIHSSAKTRMEKTIESLIGALTKLRTGRAHPSLLEQIMVPYYGNDTPLSQVATINVSDARTLLVTPWEKNMVPVVEKAILTSSLGLNPATSGNAIRIPLPPLTEERRRDLTKLVKQEAENARVAVRNIRRDANHEVKELLKAKEVTEDEVRRSEDAVQKLTDQFIKQIEEHMEKKEAELLEI